MLPAKLTVGSTFAIHPPRNGGQLRTFHLYTRVAERCPVDVVCLVAGDQPALERRLTPNLREIHVPQSHAHAVAEAELQRAAGIPVTDVAFPDLYELTPEFTAAVASSAVPGGAVVATMPYTLPALETGAAGAPVWYDSQNVEADLKAEMLPDNAVGQRLLESTRRVEASCCRKAERLFVATLENGERLRELYDLSGRPPTVVPNGVDTTQIAFVSAAQRRGVRARLQMQRPLALFIGSWHEPNLVAVRRIIGLARILGDVTFAIAGSVCLPFRGMGLSGNVELLGIVSDTQKRSLLAAASVALNPMSAGSGTNIKMLDYLSSGVPVVTTSVGARGLALDQRYAEIVPVDEFAPAIRAVLGLDPAQLDDRTVRARRHVEEHFDWSTITERLLATIAPQDTVGRPDSAKIA
jgi:glycosyltransferase involved in cell wall biosynthesis